jgi:hypothetical protein
MRALLVTAFAVLSLTFVAAASAGVPSSTTSTVTAVGDLSPACNPNGVAVCPLGDFGLVRITVTVRNVYGDPLAGKVVNCNAVPITGAFCFCPLVDPQSGVTDLNGDVVFQYIRFGGCGSLQWSADCEGVIFNPSNTINVASPDNDANCAVGLPDFGYFASVYLTADACSDYNCDGIVNLQDFGIFSSHYLHACP